MRRTLYNNLLAIRAALPRVTGASIDALGTTLTITFSKLVTGVAAADFALSTGQTLSAAAGTGPIQTMTISPAVSIGATPTLAYTAGGTVDADAHHLATFTGAAITNNSTAVVTFAGLVSASAPTAWWLMDSTADASGNGHTLTLENAPNQSQVGPIKNDAQTCTFMDGGSSQTAHAATSAALDCTGDFTYLCWVRLHTMSQFRLMGKGSSGGILLYCLGSGELRVDIPFVKGNVITSTTPLVLGEWAMIALTRSGNTWSAYINPATSAPDATATDASTVTANTDVFTIGSFWNGSSYLGTLDGWIGDVVVWGTRALTGAELAAMYAAGAKTKVTVESVVIDGISNDEIAFLFTDPLASLPANVAALAQLKTNHASGGLASPTALVNAAIGSRAVGVNYAATPVSGEPWSIDLDVAGLNFGAYKYLKTPVSGTIA